MRFLALVAALGLGVAAGAVLVQPGHIAPLRTPRLVAPPVQRLVVTSPAPAPKRSAPARSTVPSATVVTVAARTPTRARPSKTAAPPAPRHSTSVVARVVRTVRRVAGTLPTSHVPPGLAKKPGHLPPGQAKKLTGHVPPGLAKKGGLPPGQAKKLR